MSDDDFWIIAMGIGLILYGCFGKNFFYAKGTVPGQTSNKPMPIWLGKTVAITIGLLILIGEIVSFNSR